MEITEIFSAVAACASAVAAFIAFSISQKANKILETANTISTGANDISLKSKEINEKALELNSITNAYQILNDNAHRNARIRLYVAAKYLRTDKAKCKALLGRLGANVDPDIIIPESENIVLADFDQMGYLINKGLISKTGFLQAYWNTVISSYETLEVSGDKRNFFKHFKDLYEKAKDFRKDDVKLEKDVYTEYYENLIDFVGGGKP